MQQVNSNNPLTEGEKIEIRAALANPVLLSGLRKAWAEERDSWLKRMQAAALEGQGPHKMVVAAARAEEANQFEVIVRRWI